MEAITALVLVAMLIGLMGTVLPVLPGLALIWVAGLVYGIADGFDGTAITAFAVMTLLAAVGFAASVALPSRKARVAGAARSSVVLGAVGAVVGFFVIPVIGFAVIGIPAVYAGERFRGQAHEPARDATISTVQGLGWAILAQVLAGSAMIAVWLAWVFLG